MVKKIFLTKSEKTSAGRWKQQKRGTGFRPGRGSISAFLRVQENASSSTNNYNKCFFSVLSIASPVLVHLLASPIDPPNHMPACPRPSPKTVRSCGSWSSFSAAMWAAKKHRSGMPPSLHGDTNYYSKIVSSLHLFPQFPRKFKALQFCACLWFKFTQ
jgi:hypothetical protein